MELSILMISAVCRMILYVSTVCHYSLTRNLKNNSDRKIRWSKIRVLERKVNVFLSPPPPLPSPLKKHPNSFLGLKELSSKYGLGDFGVELYHMATFQFICSLSDDLLSYVAIGKKQRLYFHPYKPVS